MIVNLLMALVEAMKIAKLTDYEINTKSFYFPCNNITLFWQHTSSHDSSAMMVKVMIGTCAEVV